MEQRAQSQYRGAKAVLEWAAPSLSTQAGLTRPASAARSKSRVGAARVEVASKSGGEAMSDDGGAVAISAGSAPALIEAGSGGGVSISAGAADAGGSIELGSGEGRSEGGTHRPVERRGGAADRSGSVSLSTGDGPSSGDVRLAAKRTASIAAGRLCCRQQTLRLIFRAALKSKLGKTECICFLRRGSQGGL